MRENNTGAKVNKEDNEVVTKGYLKNYLDERDYVTKGYLKSYLDEQNYVTKEYLREQNYITKDFFLDFFRDFKNELFEALDVRFDRLEKRIDEANARTDRLIAQNALEHNKFDTRIVALEGEVF